MSDLLSIETILSVGRLAQALAQNDSSLKKIMSGASLDDDLGSKIYLERMIVQKKYDLSPNDPTLRDTANAAFRIFGIYGATALNLINQQQEGVPIVSGPANQSVNVNASVTFTITVQTNIQFSIAWYRNGVLVPGQTGTSLTFNAQLSDNGAVYNAIVTNAVGSTASQNASLTVTNALFGSYYYGATDYYSALQGGTDNVPYQGTFAITDGQPFQVTMPSGAANNVFEIYRVPVGQPAKTIWVNTPLNSGNFPDSVFYASFTLGAYRYYCSRVELSIDTTASPNMILS